MFGRGGGRAGLGLCSSVFWANRSFLPKTWANELFAQKSERFAYLLIFGERPEWFTHNCSFPLSDLSDRLTSLRGNVQIFCFFLENLQKCKKHTKYNLLEFFWANCSFFVSESEKWAIRSKNLAIRSICSFVLSDLSKLLTFAHLSWATWSNSSHSLTCHERPERFAHSCSFALSDQIKWLTYAHFSWANEWMSKWANSQPWGVGRCGLHEGVALKGDNSLCTLFSRSRAN